MRRCGSGCGVGGNGWRVCRGRVVHACAGCPWVCRGREGVQGTCGKVFAGGVRIECVCVEGGVYKRACVRGGGWGGGSVGGPHTGLRAATRERAYGRVDVGQVCKEGPCLCAGPCACARVCAPRCVRGAGGRGARGGCWVRGAVGASVCVCRRVPGRPRTAEPPPGGAQPGPALPALRPVSAAAPRRGTGGETGERGTGNGEPAGLGAARERGQAAWPRGTQLSQAGGESRRAAAGDALPGCGGTAASFPLPPALGGAVSPRPGTELLSGSAAPARVGAHGAAPRCPARPPQRSRLPLN